jgi:hypothetical protein
MSGTPTVRFKVKDLDTWGRLIKSWATHLDYVNTPYKDEPPRTDWVNTTWPNETGRTPGPKTVPDTGMPWCLPSMPSVPVQAKSGPAVNLPHAIALTVHEFLDLVTKADVKVEAMPKEYHNVIIVQGDENTLVVRLPPKDMLQGSEDDLIMSGDPYPIPAYYNKLYSGGRTSYPSTQSDIMELHAYRIGEYTLNNCA